MSIDDNRMLPFYKALIENTKDVVMLLDSKGMIQFVNPAITELFGYSPEELADTWSFDKVHPEDIGRCQQILNRILQGAEVTPFTIRYRHKDSSWRFSEVLAHYLGQDIAEVMLTARDVTGFEEDRHARRLLDSSFEAAFNASSAINSISVVETGELLTVNDGWVEALGWSREEAIGKTANDLNIWGGQNKRAKVVADMRRNAGLRGYRVELTTKSGEICVVRLDATYLHLPIGTRLYFSSLNITEQERAEEKLRQSQRLDAIGHLTGGIAHDFNNLLSVIMGHAEIAKAYPNVTGPLEESLDAIFRASVTGANLIQQLLSFSRKQQLSPTKVHLVQYLNAMRPLLQTTIEKDIELTIRDSGVQWLCLIDSLQLDNAILNITINARDAMPKGGTLDMAVSELVVAGAEAETYGVEAGDYIKLTVSDTGSGMSDVSRTHAFDPFYTTKQDMGGSGLGLSMVFGFINQSGGAVYFEPCSNGTTIVLLLPKAESEQLSENVMSDSQKTVEVGKKTLVIEDDPDVRELVAKILTSLGFEVFLAGSAQEAQAFEQTTFDLLVCDLMLPGHRKGPAIAARFREVQPNIAVLFMSGYQEGVLTAEDLAAPRVAFLHKPFSKNKFSVEIAALLDSSQ